MLDYILKMRKHTFLISSYILSIFITFVVYITGGTHTVYAIFMIIPIIITTSMNGKIKGVIHAGISGLLVGPFMPLFVDSNIRQKPINWITRILFFIAISLIINFFNDRSKKQHEKNALIEKEISESNMATIYALVKLSESRDDDTGLHIERVSKLCKLLTKKLSKLSKYKNHINSDYIDNIYKASSLHDIGKVGIPDNILLKPGKLTKEEFDIIKRHPVLGANTLLEVQNKYSHNKFLELGISIARYHHEKWDGTGYPYGLSKEDIPLPARIMALTDVYDALRSKRVYKDAYTHEKSMEIIKQGKGTHFDPEIVDTFLANEAEFNDTFEKNNMELE